MVFGECDIYSNHRVRELELRYWLICQCKLRNHLKVIILEVVRPLSGLAVNLIVPPIKRNHYLSCKNRLLFMRSFLIHHGNSSYWQGTASVHSLKRIVCTLWQTALMDGLASSLFFLDPHAKKDLGQDNTKKCELSIVSVYMFEQLFFELTLGTYEKSNASLD